MKVISGAQTGADQAGIDAAGSVRFATGGYIPKGGKTSLGRLDPSYISKMGLVELPTSDYKIRTFKNVECSDGTIRLAVNFDSPGERCTLKAITKYRKPYLDIDLLDLPSCETVLNWLIDKNIRVLNVAGNTQWTERFDIYTMTYNFLHLTFSKLCVTMNHKNGERKEEL